MKRLLTIITTMMLAMTMEAQSPLILGESHAMLRVKNETKYLLLPVQEKEENAHIAVVDSRNEMVQRLNVRLAVDKVDYYVPLDLSKLSTLNSQLSTFDPRPSTLILDITFHGERRTTGAIKDFLCCK